MPALVHTNSALQGGFAKVSESVSEDASGLVTVQMEFVCRASNNAQLHKLFYSDAPPPIFPSCIAASDLITRKLYMVDRTFQTANGLTTVVAQYAGGLISQGRPAFRYTDRESERTVDTTQKYAIQRTNPNPPYQSVIFEPVYDIDIMRFVPLVNVFEYVVVGNQASHTVSAPPRSDLYSLTYFFGSRVEPAPEQGWAARKTIIREREYFINKLQMFQVFEDIRPTYVTPTVKTIQHRFYL